jgi:hypothetical protein
VSDACFVGFRTPSGPVAILSDEVIGRRS